MNRRAMKMEKNLVMTVTTSDAVFPFSVTPEEFKGYQSRFICGHHLVVETEQRKIVFANTDIKRLELAGKHND